MTLLKSHRGSYYEFPIGLLHIALFPTSDPWNMIGSAKVYGPYRSCLRHRFGPATMADFKM